MCKLINILQSLLHCGSTIYILELQLHVVEVCTKYVQSMYKDTINLKTVINARSTLYILSKLTTHLFYVYFTLYNNHPGLLYNSLDQRKMRRDTLFPLEDFPDYQ